ncbi:MAG: TetR/AcrR family transcriptional regulator [Pikeienuella sp.]|uniref:TetR/AcrR family transcriptional regulator n=1 Tax=Pikeienuella sp. TaxID=2831957 RepID=UPI00391D3BF7
MKQSGDTKSMIVSAAIDVIQRSGLPPVSYDAIAGAAGLTRQSVRYHFPDADTLMLAVCDRLAEAYRQALIDNAARLDGPRRLEMFLDFYFDLLEGSPKPADDAVYDAMMSLATGSEPVRANLRSQYTLLGQVISHEFRLAHPALSLRSADELSFLFVSLMYGHWKMVASLGISDKHNRLTRSAIDRLIRSYCETGPVEGVVSQVWAAEC